MVTRLHLPHAFMVRLHVRKSNVAILIQETAVKRWCLSSSLSLSVGFSIQDEAMDVSQSVPQGAHFHADIIYFLPSMGIKKGASALWYSELSLHQLGSHPQSLYPDGHHTLAFYFKCVPPADVSMHSVNASP